MNPSEDDDLEQSSVLAALSPVADSELWAMEASRVGKKLSRDPFFRIKLIQPGPSIPVIISKGFLSEESQGWGNFDRMVNERYPDSLVFRVFWTAKKRIEVMQVLNLPRMIVKSDPWTESRKNAEEAGRALAFIIREAAPQNFVLVGHSLGARVMAYAVKQLAAFGLPPQLETVHLTGAAISQDKNWGSLPDAVRGNIYNYYSNNDAVLRFGYDMTRLHMTHAVGLSGFVEKHPRLVNVDCSDFIDGHQEYFTKLHLKPEP